MVQSFAEIVKNSENRQMQYPACYGPIMFWYGLRWTRFNLQQIFENNHGVSFAQKQARPQ